MPTYTHNDYYGYINKVQEKAISNPEWFWSDAASEARQWLYNNNAGKIVEDVYNNTPDDIKSRIDPKMLPSTIRTKQLVDKIHEGQNEFLDNAGAIGLQSAGIVGLGVGAAMNPIGTAGAVIGGTIGSGAMDFGINLASKGKYKDWGAFVRNNNDWGETGNLLASMTNPYGLAYGIKGFELGNNFNTNKSIFQTPERWTRGMANKARADYSDWIDAIQTFKNRRYPITDHLVDVPEGISFELDLAKEITGDQLSEFIPLSERGNLAKRANWSYDQAQKTLDFYNTHSKQPNSKSIIIDDMSLEHSFNDENGISYIGMPLNIKRPWETVHDPYSGFKINSNFAELIGHELEHNNSRFNTRMSQNILNFMTDNEKAILQKESPFYNNDYIRVPQWYKDVLKPFGKKRLDCLKENLLLLKMN